MVIAKGDSATSHHHWHSEDEKFLTSMAPNNNAQVTLPNASSMQLTIEGQLSMHPSLSTQAKKVIASSSLKS